MKVISDAVRAELLAAGLVVRCYRERRLLQRLCFAEVVKSRGGKPVVRLHGDEWEVSARLELFAEGIRYGRNSIALPSNRQTLPSSATNFGCPRGLSRSPQRG